MKQQQGFTLVEIAIVLVIIGLILGGILKGQELIDSARVRSVSNDISGMRSAWLAFQDRYNALPGDFINAKTQLDTGANNGDGDGTIDAAGEVGGVWDHLEMAGFIAGNFDGSDVTQDGLGGCDADSCPANPFNGFYKIGFNSNSLDAAGSAHELTTGNQIPVNIILQLDLKLDDGIANRGDIREHRDVTTSCSKGSSTTASDWDINSTAGADCAAALRGF